MNMFYCSNMDIFHPLYAQKYILVLMSDYMYVNLKYSFFVFRDDLTVQYLVYIHLNFYEHGPFNGIRTQFVICKS